MEDFEEWVPDKAIEALTLKRALQNVEDPAKMAADLFSEALPLATMSMVHLAIHSPTEGVRYNASKYVIERCMGSVSNPSRGVEEKSAWEKIYDNAMVVD